MANSKLTDVKAKSIKIDGRYPDNDVVGLYLRKAGESFAWVQRITVNGKRCDIGLGPYPAVSIASAREKARLNRTKVKDDKIDPLAERRADKEAARLIVARTKTFAECAEIVIVRKEQSLRNAKSKAIWRATIENYAYPTLRNKPVGTITADDIEAILEPIWHTKHETASNLRARIEVIFDYAKSKNYREGDNPAALKGNLGERLGKVKRKVKHHAALPHAEIGTFMADLRQRDGISARALEFGILTAARSGEIRLATWDEIDLNTRLWSLADDRMKAEKAHEVPLSDAAVALLKALPRVDGSPYIFPAPRLGALSDMSLTAVLKRMGRPDLTQHGFRSTFRDYCADELSGIFPREVVEHALAHQLADQTERAYQRSKMLPPRVALMEAWAKRCATPDAEPTASADNVTSIRAAA